MTVALETERLSLREMTVADLDFVAAMLADPGVMQFYPRVLSRQEAAAWIDRQLQRYAEHGHGLWLTVEKATGRPAGQIGLMTQEVEGLLEPEIGYLLDGQFWHRGFATEAGLAIRHYAFHTLNKPYVISLIRAVNLPSQAVARRLGMHPEREVIFKGLPHLVFSVARGTADRGV
jgi:[ribosomal protein S5]-alanine N-acetyltransferase